MLLGRQATNTQHTLRTWCRIQIKQRQKPLPWKPPMTHGKLNTLILQGPKTMNDTAHHKRFPTLMRATFPSHKERKTYRETVPVNSATDVTSA